MTAAVLTPIGLAQAASWIATGLGVGLWLWSWLGEKRPISRLRFQDCGVVLLFGGIVVRIVTQGGRPSAIDWAMLVLAPLFIAAALWRLGRTGGAG